MRRQLSLGHGFRLALVALAMQAAPVGSWQAEVSDTLDREGDCPLLALLVLDSQPNPQEIIQRSVKANQAYWKEAEKYSFTERDVKSKDDSVETVRSEGRRLIERIN